MSHEATPEIVLVRHGQTEWSASGRHTSHTDLPLTEEGAEQAGALGRLLRGRRFALVLCSPLRRARETCELAGLAGQAQTDPDLVEWNYGEYEGLTTDQIRASRPDWNLWLDGCPGGEQPSEVAARVDRVIPRLRDAGGDTIAFGHGHVLRVLASRWLRREPEFGAHLALSAGSLSALGFERETEVLSGWNHRP